MSCENCFSKLYEKDELFKIDGDFLCYPCKEDLEIWEKNVKTYKGPKDNKFIVGKHYSYKFNTEDFGVLETDKYECIKRTKHYIHLKNNFETLKKKVHIDIWGNEFIGINRTIMESYED